MSTGCAPSTARSTAPSPASSRVTLRPRWMLEDILRRHIDKEENGLFPAAVIALDGPAWERVVSDACMTWHAGVRPRRPGRRHAPRRPHRPASASAWSAPPTRSSRCATSAPTEPFPCPTATSMGNTIECWMHGSRFDLRTGAALNLPATEAVPTFPVRVIDGIVGLDMP